MDALGITEETARLLTQGGMGDLATLTSGVDVADIADVLGGDTALARADFRKSQGTCFLPRSSSLCRHEDIQHQPTAARTSQPPAPLA
jgi:hypothetical protein